MNTFQAATAALMTTIIMVLMPANQTGAIEPVTTPIAVITPEVVEPVEAPAQLTLINANTEQTATVAESISLFEAANLELPPLQIEFHDTAEGCKGHEGFYRPVTAERPALTDRIDICNRLTVILLHELAHAWKHHNLDSETKDAFTAHWGLDDWNDKTDAHGDRGVERAAHTIAFTLNQSEPTVSESILRYICDYELLTGSTLEIHTHVDC